MALYMYKTAKTLLSYNFKSEYIALIIYNFIQKFQSNQ